MDLIFESNQVYTLPALERKKGLNRRMKKKASYNAYKKISGTNACRELEDKLCATYTAYICMLKLKKIITQERFFKCQCSKYMFDIKMARPSEKYAWYICYIYTLKFSTLYLGFG